MQKKSGGPFLAQQFGVGVPGTLSTSEGEACIIHKYRSFRFGVLSYGQGCLRVIVCRIRSGGKFRLLFQVIMME